MPKSSQRLAALTQRSLDGNPARAKIEWLSGERLHLSDGPIDLIIRVDGDENSVSASLERAATRFGSVLDELIGELPSLRAPFTPRRTRLNGRVAKRMARAVEPHAGRHVSAMIAVAGAVADEILAAITADKGLERAYVNNGGDIALFLRAGARFSIGTAAQPTIDCVLGGARIEVTADDDIGGVATSGLGGRSFTLGIADAVTVLATTAADADVAATLIANEVDVDDDRIERIAAHELDPDSDLGDRLVTVSRPSLPPAKITAALDKGSDLALQMLQRKQIRSALVQCAGQSRVLGHDVPIRALT